MIGKQPRHLTFSQSFVTKLDYYDILGVPRTATADDIRAAHRTLARQYHPDTAEDGEGDEVIFAQVQEAYEVLSSKEQRRRYDIRLARVRGETAPGAKRRPPRSPCAVCGCTVYSNQLRNYLGRFMCKDCLDRMGRHEGKQIKSLSGSEFRWHMQRLWLFVHANLAVVCMIAIAFVAAAARIAWVGINTPHAAAYAAPMTPANIAPAHSQRTNPCAIKPIAGADVPADAALDPSSGADANR